MPLSLFFLFFFCSWSGHVPQPLLLTLVLFPLLLQPTQMGRSYQPDPTESLFRLLHRKLPENLRPEFRVQAGICGESKRFLSSDETESLLGLFLDVTRESVKAEFTVYKESNIREIVRVFDVLMIGSFVHVQLEVVVRTSSCEVSVYRL